MMDSQMDTEGQAQLMTCYNRTIRRLLPLLLLAAAALSLGGCMYPNNQLKENQAPPRDAVRNVQAAIDDYYKETGLLPIKNSTMETPRYEKFAIDFSQLKQKGFLSEIPPAAFENGGHYYFIVIDEETAPRVKLMDLITVQYINDLNQTIREYMDKHQGLVPKGEQVYPGFYRINYKQMNTKEKTLRSVYSGQKIETMIDDNGNAYVDYAFDLMQAIQKSGLTSFQPETDLRALLVDNTLYVPVKSVPYRYVNGEPVALAG
ncbi:hypothetical protein [Paenibacillus protaetiae]|uniref:DUF3939 domain-containing protein n=1 Tax=Paenibacillus protaetiae TaxID=2509456 RepID=A0A4P6ETF1_9BACL|nr:hypothetical protein [Paenibacillus protaetiae]QAY66174.1 hypothetical protein ET464_06950 [Paenibacillus protaetiae]